MYGAVKFLAITMTVIAVVTYFGGEVDRALLLLILSGILDISADLKRPTPKN